MATKRPVLFTVKRSGNDHTHTAWLSPDGTGYTSVDKNHAHPVQLAVDPNTGQPVLDEQGMPQLIILPAEDGHTHNEYNRLTYNANKLDDQAELELSSYITDLWSKALNYEREWRAEALDNEDMMVPSKQWSNKAREELAKKQKPAISIPFIPNNVDTLLGVFMGQSSDISVVPFETSDIQRANLLKALLKFEQSKNKFQFHLRKSFEDQLITGRGNLRVRIDFSKNLDGEIIIERVPWEDVYYAPHQLEDMSDCKYLILSKWMDLRTFKDRYPDKADKVDAFYTYLDEAYKSNDEYEDSIFSTFSSNRSELKKVENHETKIRIIEIQRKNTSSIPVVIDPEGNTFSLEFLSKDVVKQVGTIQGLSVKTLVFESIKITRIAGGVVLFDVISQFSDFSIFPSYGRKRGSNISSFVGDQKDQQREINKRHSQLAHWANTMAGDNYMVDSKALSSQTRRQIKKGLSGYGNLFEFDSEKAATADPIRLVPQSQPPSGLFDALNTEMDAMLRAGGLLGLSPSLKAESGVLESLRQKQALLAHEKQFENMRICMANIGKVLLDAIKIIYLSNPRRTARLLLSNTNIQKDNPSLTNYDEQDLIDLLKTTDIEKFDVLVSSSPASSTQRELDRMSLIEAARVGMISPEVAQEAFLELSNFYNVDKIRQVAQSSAKAASEDKAMTNKMQLAASFNDDANKKEMIQRLGIIQQPTPDEIQGNSLI